MDVPPPDKTNHNKRPGLVPDYQRNASTRMSRDRDDGRSIDMGELVKAVSAPSFLDHEANAMDNIAAMIDHLNEFERFHILAWIVARWMPQLLVEFGQATEIPVREEIPFPVIPS